MLFIQNIINILFYIHKNKCTGKCYLELDIEKSKYSVEVNKIFHITYHSFPEDLKYIRQISFYLLGFMWIYLYPFSQKLRCLICSFLYSFIEYIFTYLTGKRAFTSFAQFYGNLLYTPILLDFYGYVFHKYITLYILLFPFNIWILEIILDILFNLLYGRNVAWCYHEYNDSKINGVIRIGHGKFWIFLGIICYFFYPPLLIFTNQFET